MANISAIYSTNSFIGNCNNDWLLGRLGSFVVIVFSSFVLCVFTITILRFFRFPFKIVTMKIDFHFHEITGSYNRYDGNNRNDGNRNKKHSEERGNTQKQAEDESSSKSREFSTTN
ncbi:hypothetical protein M3Y98_00577700 [Aphelenchoides besseyi]|nr:hypothetical protein M3Y98_00577700 [Aphelenchoides besseyi]